MVRTHKKTPAGWSPTEALGKENLSMTTITVAYETPDGNQFTYELTGITRKCWSIKALHTGKIERFNSKRGLRTFCRELAAHLDRKYAAVAVAA